MHTVTGGSTRISKSSVGLQQRDAAEAFPMGSAPFYTDLLWKAPELGEILTNLCKSTVAERSVITAVCIHVAYRGFKRKGGCVHIINFRVTTRLQMYRIHYMYTCYLTSNTTRVVQHN